MLLNGNGLCPLMHDGVRWDMAAIGSHKRHARSLRAELWVDCLLATQQGGQAFSAPGKKEPSIKGDEQGQRSALRWLDELVACDAQPTLPRALAPQFLIKGEPRGKAHRATCHVRQLASFPTIHIIRPKFPGQRARRAQ